MNDQISNRDKCPVCDKLRFEHPGHQLCRLNMIDEITACMERMKKVGAMPTRVMVNPVLLTPEYRPKFEEECNRLGLKLEIWDGMPDEQLYVFSSDTSR